MLCLHCSPPTSDCREAPEQKEPNRLLTDTGESSEHPVHPMAARRAAPPIPGDPRTGTPAQLAQPPRLPRCAWSDRAAHTSRRTR